MKRLFRSNGALVPELLEHPLGGCGAAGSVGR
jgi:hypothetical protein